MTINSDYGAPPSWADEPWAGFRATNLEMPDETAFIRGRNETSRHRRIRDITDRAYINGFCAAFSGDCPAVAGALAKVFDADALVWLVNEPGDPWPMHALIRKDDRIYDAKGVRTRNDLREYAARCLDEPVENVNLDVHLDEHDPAEFEILDETALAQRIIDERIVPAIRGEDWN